MKKILSLSLAAFVLITFTSAGNLKGPVAQGKTNSSLGIYTVDKAGKLEMIKGDALRTYEIRYENSPDTVLVAVDDTKKGVTRYLVISDDLVVEYIAGLEYFGARIIGERFAKEGFSTPQQNLDIQQYYHQKLITAKPLTETEHLCLISVYFPKLIKEYDRIFATKD
ncbi:MAG: hypothetical protein RQ743_01235 [Bacteroidales bacterium]|nr:hypothetical protein [Bacteroidales bacterium]